MELLSVRPVNTLDSNIELSNQNNNPEIIDNDLSKLGYLFIFINYYIYLVIIHNSLYIGHGLMLVCNHVHSNFLLLSYSYVC